MKIALLNCLYANDVCAGTSCFCALNERRAAFEIYKDEPIKVTAFLRCSTCGKTAEEDKGMLEKLERLVKEGTECVHIGICGYQKWEKRVCPCMRAHADWLSSHGIRIVWGTHSFFPEDRVVEKKQ